jgi:type IV pilus assembly protein PilX
MKQRTPKISLSKQSGAVLLVSLIMLLLLTIIGLSAVNITTLDTRIAANSRDRGIAFDAAETALNVATEAIAPGRDLPDSSMAGYQSVALADQWWRIANATWWGTNAEKVTDYNGRSETQNYVVELPTEKGSTSLTLGLPKPITRYYRVTARGEGQGGANVHVQTIYARKVYNNAAN